MNLKKLIIPKNRISLFEKKADFCLLILINVFLKSSPKSLTLFDFGKLGIQLKKFSN